MISEFDAGSAWMKPPVDGCADALNGAVAGVAPAAVLWPAAVCAAVRPVACATPATLAPPPPNAARSTVASLVESAFFSGTTQMLPAAPAPGCAWSSR